MTNSMATTTLPEDVQNWFDYFNLLVTRNKPTTTGLLEKAYD